MYVKAKATHIPGKKITEAFERAKGNRKNVAEEMDVSVNKNTK